MGLLRQSPLRTKPSPAATPLLRTSSSSLLADLLLPLLQLPLLLPLLLLPLLLPQLLLWPLLPATLTPLPLPPTPLASPTTPPTQATMELSTLLATLPTELTPAMQQLLLPM